MHIEAIIENTPETILAALVQGLEIEFGSGAGEALARRFLDAEETDFLWDARIAERWIGSFEHGNEDGFELDRVSIFGRLGRSWFAAIMIIDGEGQPHGTIARRDYSRRSEAEVAFIYAR